MWLRSHHYLRLLLVLFPKHYLQVNQRHLHHLPHFLLDYLTHYHRQFLALVQGRPTAYFQHLLILFPVQEKQPSTRRRLNLHLTQLVCLGQEHHHLHRHLQ